MDSNKGNLCIVHTDKNGIHSNRSSCAYKEVLFVGFTKSRSLCSVV